MNWSDADRAHMAQALGLAQHVLYTTTPNPRVGCVLVQAGTVIGQGATQPAGRNHAEIEALEDAANRHAVTAGATAYVSLEPCSHYGLTAPCADALIAAGIRRVVAAMADPNPLVAGQGLERLRAAGVITECGLMEVEARKLNIGFVARMSRGRPWLSLKIAASLDGKTALNNGRSQWLTGEAARADGHHWRARACAVLTGIGTVKSDDPQLTVRAVSTPRQPLRVLVDSRLELPLTARLLDGDRLLVANASEDSEKAAALAARGAELLCLPDARGKVDLRLLLEELGRRGINEVHAEAGAALNASLLKAGLVDELLVYLAPCLIGDAARGMFALPALEDLAERRELEIIEVARIGGDLRIIARIL